MARRIILLSDGTGNSAAKIWRTNVWRVFERLDLTNSDQVACYDDGVGTETFKPLAMLGGVFGFGLKRNVLDLYKFACRSCRSPDDEIYGFGFSRGAFTMRIVTGLIAHQGLVTAQTEAELDQKARAAYRAYRADRYHTKWPKPLRPERWWRSISRVFGRRPPAMDDRRPVKIRFLGLWDTVAAYGLPIEELATGANRWIYPWMMPDFRLTERVQRACHALSIDDERTTFHPVLWDESREVPLAPDQNGKRLLRNERISQVWFPGVHSNVGGGYPDDSIAMIPLVWIMSEAGACGLRFKQDAAAGQQTVAFAAAAQDKDGRIYDSRSGLGGYYRYGPRDLDRFAQSFLSRGAHEPRVRIHESAFRRIESNAFVYGPLGIPAKYEVVGSDGEIIDEKDKLPEEPQQAHARWTHQQSAWNLVQLRRLVYFATVLVTLNLLLFPITSDVPPGDYRYSSLRFVSDAIERVGHFLPSGTLPWVRGYRAEPGRTLVVAGLLAVLMSIGAALSARIRSSMSKTWQQALARQLTPRDLTIDRLYRLRTSWLSRAADRQFKRRVGPTLGAIAIIYLGLVVLNRSLFEIQDSLGWVCREQKTRLETLAPGEILLGNGSTRKLEYLKARSPIFNSLSEQDKKDPFKYVADLPVFHTNRPCQSMGLHLSRYAKYRIRLESTESFADAEIPAFRGFNSVAPAGWRGKVAMLAGLPLRRELLEPWFTFMVRVGGKGGEQIAIDYDDTEARYKVSYVITTRRAGELFFFVNDAVIGVPGYYGAFYGNNKGKTRVLIEQLP